MKNILHIISSSRGEESISIKLGNAILEKLKATYPGSTVKETDLTKHPFPHLDSLQIEALRTPLANHAPKHTEAIKPSDEAVRDLQEADIIIIGVPLINFGIPSSLKSWLDNIVRAGVTFSYDENGPKGLLTGKKVYIALATGGVYSEGPMQGYDHATPYLNNMLNFIGLTDITVIRAEGTAIPGIQNFALEKAVNSILV